MKAKEDPDLERKVGEWLEDLLGESISDTSDLHKSLKDGIVLIKYVSNSCIICYCDRVLCA